MALIEFWADGSEKIVKPRKLDFAEQGQRENSEEP